MDHPTRDTSSIISSIRRGATHGHRDSSTQDSGRMARSMGLGGIKVEIREKEEEYGSKENESNG